MVVPSGNDLKCDYVDPPSIQFGEHIPFRWSLEKSQNIQSLLTCGSNGFDATKVNVVADTLICEFSLKDARGTTYTFTRPCAQKLDYNSSNLRLFSRFTLAGTNFGNAYSRAMGASYIPASDRSSKFTNYGEYQISLEKIYYTQCLSAGSGYITQSKVYDRRVCSYNIAVTRPYLIQKGSALSSNSNDALSNFYGFSSNAGTTNILSKYGINITNTPLSSYNGSTNLTYLLTQFVTKYSGLAVSANNMVSGIKKVPNKEIYVYDGNMTYAQNTTQNKAMTIIVKNGNLTVR